MQLREDGRRGFDVHAMPPSVSFEEVAAAFKNAVIGAALERDSTSKGRKEPFEKVFIYRRVELTVKAKFTHQKFSAKTNSATNF